MRKIVERAAILASAGLLAFGAAACGGGGGGGGEQLTAEEYAAELEAICTEFNATQEEFQPESLEDFAEAGPAVHDAFEEAIAAVEALEPPDELADTADEFVAAGRQQLDLLSQLIDAAAAGDEEKVSELAEEGSEADTESDALAEELGAPACTE